MAAVTEATLATNLLHSMWTDGTTIDTVTWTKTGTPANQGATSSIQSRTVNMHEFNGSTDFYTADLTGYCDTDSGIISFWMKPDFDETAAANRVIFRFKDADGSEHINMFLKDSINDFACQMKRAGSTIEIPTTGIDWTVGDILHVFLVWDKDAGLDSSNSFELYINGVLKASTTTTWLAKADELTASVFGSNGTTSDFDGSMYDLAFYNYATLAASHTDAEILTSIYNNDY